MNITTLIPDEHGDIEWPDVDKDRRVVITLGAFDGMHRGHQAVIDRVVELAKRHDAGSAVMLFDPRPAFVHAHGGNTPEVDADALSGGRLYALRPMRRRSQAPTYACQACR